MTNQKALQAIHFICAVAEGLPLGATRLNKILWFAEKDNFLRTLQPMLGLSFVKGPYGPLPPGVAPACEALAANGIISLNLLDYGSYIYEDMHSLCDPNTSLLTDQELMILRDLTLKICTEHTASGISDLTHNAIYYMLSMGEPYPLELTLVENARPATDAELADLLADCEA